MSNRRRFPYCLAISLLAGWVLASGCSPDPAAPREAGADRPGVVRLAPVVRLSASGPFAVPLSFANGSDQPFTYVFSYGEIVGFDYALYRDGKNVRGDAPQVGQIPNPVYTTKTLKAGESLTYSYKLRRHQKLKAGEYELEIAYKVHKGATLDLEYNATPAQFTLSYTLIVE